MSKRPLAALFVAACLPLAAHAAVLVSINIAPPILPVYVQPAIPAPGYIWTPGYWRWNPVDADYYWIPGTWFAPPYVGALWTPGYWGWGGGGYLWHGGYWGRHIGFYGGVNYGYGYGGHGYQGGYWNGGVFNYNRSVNNINTTIVHNTYNTTVVNNNTRVSFNGGQGGIGARPTNEERAARSEPHAAPTPMQRQHEQVALRTPEQRASINHGNPAFAATPRPGDMRAERGGRPGEPNGGARRAPEGGERMHAQEGERQRNEATGERPRGEAMGQRPRGEAMGERPQPEHNGGGMRGGEPHGDRHGGGGNGGGRDRER